MIMYIVLEDLGINMNVIQSRGEKRITMKHVFVGNKHRKSNSTKRSFVLVVCIQKAENHYSQPWYFRRFLLPGEQTVRRASKFSCVV